MPAWREAIDRTRSRGRRPKASEERTRGTAAKNWRLWGFGRAAVLTEDHVALIGASWTPPMMADGVCRRGRGHDRGVINGVVPALAGAGLKRARRREREV